MLSTLVLFGPIALFFAFLYSSLPDRLDKAWYGLAAAVMFALLGVWIVLLPHFGPESMRTEAPLWRTALWTVLLISLLAFTRIREDRKVMREQEARLRALESSWERVGEAMHDHTFKRPPE